MNLLDCTTVQRVAGTQLPYVGSPPPSAGSALCWIDDEYGTGVPTIPADKPFSVGVAYLPAGVSTASNTFEEVVARGGILIELRVGAQHFEPPIQPSKENGFAIGTVQGHRAVVRRDTTDRVSISWEEPLGSARLVQLSLFAKVSPDEILRLANDVQRGLPPNEGTP